MKRYTEDIDILSDYQRGCVEDIIDADYECDMISSEDALRELFLDDEDFNYDNNVVESAIEYYFDLLDDIPNDKEEFDEFINDIKAARYFTTTFNEEVCAGGSSGISACAPENVVSLTTPGAPSSDETDEDEKSKTKKLLAGTGL